MTSKPRHTANGTPIVWCERCGREHPDVPYRCVSMCDLCGIVHLSTRHHCVQCGRPSVFIAGPGLPCLTCAEKEARQ